MSDERVKKLPVWAQRLVNKLEADVEHWRKKAMAAVGEGDHKTDTFLIDYSLNSGYEVGLPPGTTIRFHLDKHWVEARVREDRIDVRSDQQLVAEPRSANALDLKVRNF